MSELHVLYLTPTSPLDCGLPGVLRIYLHMSGLCVALLAAPGLYSSGNFPLNASEQPDFNGEGIGQMVGNRLMRTDVSRLEFRVVFESRWVPAPSVHLMDRRLFGQSKPLSLGTNLR